MQFGDIKICVLWAACLLCMLCLSGCLEESALEKQVHREIQLCIDKGGVPVRSPWNTNIMIDCIYLSEENHE